MLRIQRASNLADRFGRCAMLYSPARDTVYIDLPLLRRMPA